ncbi:MAG TPA: methenyltetrahydromethanopterin cyclohydrolase [Xanthobacteraceae bacterium]|nr:methenyltetrahydromethanopterin cyclohydrolase [Xanthobacteraceae bacterium]
MSEAALHEAAPLSVNAAAARAVERLKADAAKLKIAVARGSLGETLIDAGQQAPGSIAAGLRLADICMGGLGTIELVTSAATPRWPWTLTVRSSHPVTACLASQYAGWRLKHGEGKDAFFALASGPGRALARREPLFETLDYRDAASSATLVLESSRPPPAAIVRKVADDCGVPPERLTFIYAPTQSLAGSVQITARVLEVALHKAHELKFPLDRIVEGLGAAPLAPPHPDLVTAMGRTNDAIIYAGRVHLFVTGAADAARSLAEQLPSERSRDYGRPFVDIFKRAKGDFYAIDPMLFSPAEVIVTALDTGESFHHGRVDLSLLDASFA